MLAGFKLVDQRLLDDAESTGARFAFNALFDKGSNEERDLGESCLRGRAPAGLISTHCSRA